MADPLCVALCGARGDGPLTSDQLKLLDLVSTESLSTDAGELQLLGGWREGESRPHEAELLEGEGGGMRDIGERFETMKFDTSNGAGFGYIVSLMTAVLIVLYIIMQSTVQARRQWERVCRM